MATRDKITADDVHNWSTPYVQEKWAGKLTDEQLAAMAAAETRHHQRGTDAQVEADAVNRMIEGETPAKHTPGPWEVFHDDKVIVRVPNRAGAMMPGYVCTLNLSPRSTRRGPPQSYPDALAERTANAHLIAAAPEMYELLKEMAEHPPACQAHIMEAAPRAGCECWQCERTGRAVALVTKAEGRP